MLSTLRERLVRHPLAAWAIGLALLAGTLALGAPYGARMFRVSREFRDRPGLYERILAALPEDGAWQFDALSYPSCGVKVRLVHVHGEDFQERVRRDGWPDEEVFAFRSLHEYQVLHALQDPELSDIPPDVVPRIEGRLSDWREFVDRHTDSCPATRPVQSPGRVVASVPMEFNRQQEAPMELALCRLARAE
jgi:hypothetical protein